MTGDHANKERLSAIFNSMSLFDKCKLRFSGLMREIPRIIRDDTKKHPWRFPFYALYLGCLLTPLPFPGDGGIIIGLTVLWTSLQLTPWSRWAHGRLKEAFDGATLVERNRAFIVPGESGQAAHLRNTALAKYTALGAAHDTKRAYMYARVGWRQWWQDLPEKHKIIL